MKSLFMLFAFGAVLCANVSAESAKDNSDTLVNLPLVKTRFGTKTQQFIRPLRKIQKSPVVAPVNTTAVPESTRTTYNWGQHTSTQAPNQNSTGAASNGTTYDWGQHTKPTQAPNQNSTGASNGTTYDWGQHTGSTFDWGKYTSTQSPNQNSTGASNGTTYDWGQHTKPTQSPNQNSTAASSGTTYDWGQHTGSTYDWGQHTKPTQAPNQNGTDNGQNNNGTDNNQNQHKCGAGSYACSGAPGLCISLKQICNGIIDCPHADDEEPRVCHPAYVPASNAANSNRFRGQGFMFHIRRSKITGG